MKMLNYGKFNQNHWLFFLIPALLLSAACHSDRSIKELGQSAVKNTYELPSFKEELFKADYVKAYAICCNYEKDSQYHLISMCSYLIGLKIESIVNSKESKTMNIPTDDFSRFIHDLSVNIDTMYRIYGHDNRLVIKVCRGKMINYIGIEDFGFSINDVIFFKTKINPFDALFRQVDSLDLICPNANGTVYIIK